MPTPNAVLGADSATVWYLNTTEGLMAYHYRRHQKEQLLPPEQLPVAYLNGTCRPAKRDVFIALKQGLLHYELQTRRVTHFFTARPDDRVGVPQEVLKIFFSRDGTGWLPTRAGLIRFSPEAPGGYRFVSLPLLDPRFHWVEAVAEDPQGRLWLGTTREGILVLDQNTFTLQFAALDYLNEEPTQYQYRLAGQDANFTPPGPENSARYARVPPGRYTFEVRALDGLGRWTPTRRLPVVVMPHFWQTTWFPLLAVFVLATAVFGAFRLYLRYRMQAQQRLTRQVVAAQEYERRRIAQDLHDDLGNTLAAAKGLLGCLEEPLAKQPSIQEITEIISRASDDVRAISHDLMPVEFERYALGDTLRLLAEKMRASSEIAFEFVQAGQERKLPPERELVIYRIVSELMTNVLKHSKAKLAVLQLLYQPDSLVLSVEDDGVGDRSLTNPPEKPGIGLKNPTSRCQYLSARLTYQADAHGTLVLVEIPDAAAPRPGARAHRRRPPAV